ncbi:MAG: hypothetical protein IH584_05540 [Candidatus Aminicenantes bacterium]|nr:hypothetical protein [Candidatus Aminicenantes bacterium]
MKKVILTQRYSEEAISLLQHEFQLLIAADHGPDIPRFLQRHADADGLISFLSDPIDGATIKGLKKLKHLKNTVLLPHLGSATGKTRRSMAMMTVQAVRRALNGKRPRHLIPEWKERLRKQGTGFRT